MIWWWWWWSGEEETEDRASMVAVEVVVSSLPESPLHWDISKGGRSGRRSSSCGAQMLQLRASRDAEVSPVAVEGLVFSGSRRHLRGELVGEFRCAAQECALQIYIPRHGARVLAQVVDSRGRNLCW